MQAKINPGKIKKFNLKEKKLTFNNLTKLVELINLSKKPLFIAGGGVESQNKKKFLDLAYNNKILYLTWPAQV